MCIRDSFVRETARYYPELSGDDIRVVVVHAGEMLLPELGDDLGRYTQRKLGTRKVEVMTGTAVASYDGATVRLNDGSSIPARTLIWTAGVTPSHIVSVLPVAK